MTEPEPPLVTVNTDELSSRLAHAQREVSNLALFVKQQTERADALTKRVDAFPKALVDVLDERDAAHAKEVQSLRDDLVAQKAEWERQLSTVRLTACEYNLTDAGCKANDRTFDNAEPINRVFSRLGGNAGLATDWINTSLYLPGGAWYCKTPIEFPRKTGLRIRGNGLTYCLNENSYWSPNEKATGGPASRLVYVGDAAKPAIKIWSRGLVWDGLVLQRGPQLDARSEMVRDGSIGIEFAGNASPPNGCNELRSLAVLGFDTAIHTAAGDGGGSHADTTEVGFAWIQDCRTVFRSDCPQSTGWRFRNLAVGGPCETVFDWQLGGGMRCDQLELTTKALVLRLRAPTHHVSAFKLGYLKVDGVWSGWRLVEVTDKAWLLHLSVWGEIGRGATPAPDAVRIPGPAGRQFIDVNMVDGNTGTIWDWRKSAVIGGAK